MDYVSSFYVLVFLYISLRTLYSNRGPQTICAMDITWGPLRTETLGLLS